MFIQTEVLNWFDNYEIIILIKSLCFNEIHEFLDLTNKKIVRYFPYLLLTFTVRPVEVLWYYLRIPVTQIYILTIMFIFYLKLDGPTKSTDPQLNHKYSYPCIEVSSQY